ncbi:hypothetical protein [Roseimicrobium gellanilyticum]|nr:hypothetical protein [Roseimicrobium gellanilyticum]
MKVFRVILNSFGSTFVEADTYEQGTSVRFYRAGHVTAEYLASAVKSVEETGIAPQGQLFSTSPLFRESRA